MKYYKRKLSEEDIQAIKDGKAKGLTHEAVAKIFNISISTVQYHTNPKYKADNIARIRKFQKKHPERCKKYYKENKPAHYRSMCFSLIRNGLRNKYFTKEEVQSVLNEQ